MKTIATIMVFASGILATHCKPMSTAIVAVLLAAIGSCIHLYSNMKK